MFWVISVYFNIKNTLPKSGTFLLGHPVYMHIQDPYSDNCNSSLPAAIPRRVCGREAERARVKEAWVGTRDDLKGVEERKSPVLIEQRSTQFIG